MAILKSGYVYVWDKNRKRHNYEHRLVMEKYLRRELEMSETVHHKNGDKQDNRMENLILCRTMADHRKEEGKWGPIKQAICNLCDKKHHAKGLCKTHYAKEFRKKQNW